MSRRLGVIMDPVEQIKGYKDTTVGLLREAIRRGYVVTYFQPGDLLLRDGVLFGMGRPLETTNSDSHWYTLGPMTRVPMIEFDVLLMRKDPPFDMEYIYTTYLLEQAERDGVLVVNKPQSLRDANEKLFATWFPQHTPATLVTRRFTPIRDFLAEHGDIIIKPLDGMGGSSVFRIKHNDPNINVILENMTLFEQRFIMAQQYLPAVIDGDKRILMIDGIPIPYALARIPAPGETRANLAAGGRGEGRPLTPSDHRICAAVGPTLRDKGLLFVGLDVIGEHLTEINVTSPTGLRELEKTFDINIASTLFEAIERRLNSLRH